MIAETPDVPQISVDERELLTSSPNQQNLAYLKGAYAYPICAAVWCNRFFCSGPSDQNVA